MIHSYLTDRENAAAEVAEVFIATSHQILIKCLLRRNADDTEVVIHEADAKRTLDQEK